MLKVSLYVLNAIPIIAFFSLPPAATADLYTSRSRTYSVGPNPCSIASADLNDDGAPDYVTADRGELVDLKEERPANDEISILLSQPDGGYLPHQPRLKTGFGPYDIALANIDNLKDPDIVVVNFHDSYALRHRDVFLFLNLKQEGIFKTEQFRVPSDGLPYLRHKDGDEVPYFSKPGLTSLKVQDLDKDGLRDVLATGWSSDVLVFLPGNDQKYFDDTAIKFSPARGGPCDLQLVDLDNDSTADAVAVMSATNEVVVFKGDGHGGFEEKSRFLSRGHQPSRVQCGDINRDGKPDIAVSHPYAEDSIDIFYGDGGFGFSVSQEIQLGDDLQILEQEIRDLVLDDLDGDGRLDLAAACYASGKVVVLLNESGEGRVQSFRRESYTFAEGKPRALCSAAFPDRQKKNLAVALWDANAVVILQTK